MNELYERDNTRASAEETAALSARCDQILAAGNAEQACDFLREATFSLQRHRHPATLGTKISLVRDLADRHLFAGCFDEPASSSNSISAVKTSQ